MKHSSHIITIAALTLLGPWLTACGDLLETDGNGALGGFWHLETVDTLATNGQLNLKSEYKFWSFQAKLFQLSEPQNDYNVVRYISNFSRNGSTLQIDEMHQHNRSEGDPLLEDMSKVAPFGINKDRETFTIEQLGSSKMVLRSETLRLSFTKF